MWLLELNWSILSFEKTTPTKIVALSNNFCEHIGTWTKLSRTSTKLGKCSTELLEESPALQLEASVFPWLLLFTHAYITHRHTYITELTQF